MSEPTAEDKANQEKAFNFSSYNKLHWMLGGEDYALKMARDMFVSDLTRARQAERDFCDRYGQSPMMTNEVFNQICDLATRAANFYEVEALARFVFDENYIPTLEQVRRRSGDLRKIMPVWDILKATNTPKRSF